MSTNGAPASPKKPWHKKWWIWLAVVVVIALIGSLLGGDDETTDAAPTTEQTPDATTDLTEEPSEPEPSEPAEEPTPDKFTFEAVDLGDGTSVDVRFEISDNLTRGFIRSGAQSDTVEALQAAVEEHPDAAIVYVYGSFPTTDAYGNEDITDILRVSYNRETIDKINFDNIDPSNIWEIRDGGTVHPDLEG